MYDVHQLQFYREAINHIDIFQTPNKQISKPRAAETRKCFFYFALSSSVLKPLLNPYLLLLYPVKHVYSKVSVVFLNINYHCNYILHIQRNCLCHPIYEEPSSHNVLHIPTKSLRVESQRGAALNPL